jgi:hypothetical protein
MKKKHTHTHTQKVVRVSQLLVLSTSADHPLLATQNLSWIPAEDSEKLLGMQVLIAQTGRRNAASSLLEW